MNVLKGLNSDLVDDWVLDALMVATKSAEPNTVLVLLSTADAESHGCASSSWLGRAVLNLVIPSLRVQGTLATFQTQPQLLVR